MQLTDIPKDKRWLAKFWIQYAIGRSGARISRGRAYASSGAVISLSIDEGHIAARVAGSRRRPYQVDIWVPEWPDEVWKELIQKEHWKDEEIDELKAGVLSETIYGKLAFEVGFSYHEMVPARSSLNFECSCPDWGRPCKHVAAVLFETGYTIAIEPRYLFRLRGMDLETFIERLTALRRREAANLAIDIPGVADRIPVYGLSSAVNGVVLAAEAPADPATYWGDPKDLTLLLQPVEKTSRSASRRKRPIDELGVPDPISWSRVFRQAMTSWYDIVQEQAELLIRDTIPGFSITPRSRI